MTAVDSIATRTVSPLRETAGADLLALKSGAALEARLLAITSEGTMTLATRLGEITVAGGKDAFSSAVGQRLTMLIDAVDARTGQLQVTLRPAAEVGSLAGGSPAVQTNATSGAVQALADAVESAVGQQDGSARLYPTLERLAAAPAESVPASVRTAAQAVLGLRLAVDDPPDAGAVKAAVRGSGLFLESGLASGRAVASAPSDTKAALLVLRQALVEWGATSRTMETGGRAEPTAPLQQHAATAVPVPQAAPTLGRVAGTAPSADPQTGPPSNDAAAADGPSAPDMLPAPTLSIAKSGPQPSIPGPQSAPPSQAEAAADPERPAPETELRPTPASQPATPPATSGLNAGAAEARLIVRALQALGQLAVGHPTEAPPQEAPFRDSPHPRDLASIDRPPPPRRGGPLRAETAFPFSEPAGEDIQSAASRAKAETEGALARLTLSQAASLPPDVKAADPATARNPEWTFNVPLLSRGETSVAQFRIERDEQGKSRDPRATVDGPTWRVRFCLDIAPVGPVHARLTLIADRLMVGLWTERPEAAALLAERVNELRAGLEARDLSVDEIHLDTGIPATEPASGPSVGHFVNRNA